ncbi:hypothetical protein BWQ96_00609 [Gracilariopsis chorda]|uniref:Uncharacterized protein n=1 Tax=Gracilariopsis chorda TaxID=448386 RepID=A0A2V3J569_9FLOR|nr:hypothetical protein BWQ96_00609 [Gracilariopsis chorda]|eukprot:PXF49539.1 hypothetical protein BWQ96_00609 [Gracilariopsis chorda]
MERSSNFPEILDLSQTVGFDDEQLRDDFLRTSERNREGNIRKYKFLSCHGNLPGSAFQLLRQDEVPTMRDFLNLSVYSLRDLLPIRIIRYLRDVSNQDTYHVTYSVRERFPRSEFVYDKYGANWKMNDVLDYLVLAHKPADSLWEIGLKEAGIGTLVLHQVLSELLNISKMALAASSLVNRENEDDTRSKLRNDNNVSKSLVTALVLTRVFLKELIQMACAEEQSPIVHLVCGFVPGENSIIKAVPIEGTLRFESDITPPPEWQVLADLVPSTFLSTGVRVIDQIFTVAVAKCLELVDEQTEFDFESIQDLHDTTTLSKSMTMQHLVGDVPRVQNFLDDLDDVELLEVTATAVDTDWREAEEVHLASIGQWDKKLSTERIDGIKVRSFETGLMVKSKNPERYKLYNEDRSLAMVVEFAHDGLRIVRRGTLKDLVKRYIPILEANSMWGGGKFKDSWVMVSRGDPSDVANAVFAGCYGSRAAVWLLGKLAFSSTRADRGSPEVIAGRDTSGIQIRTMLGHNVVRNLIFLTDYRHVYMFYPGTYGLKRLVHRGDYYECVDTDILSTRSMKMCKLYSVKEMV